MSDDHILPRPLLEALGVTPRARATFVLADGRSAKPRPRSARVAGVRRGASPNCKSG
jgi:hypothetical protein